MARDMSTSGPTLSSPPWAQDFLGREHLIPGGSKVDAAQFSTLGSVVVTVGAAGAAIGAVAVPVAALSGPIPAGTILDFTGAGKLAVVTVAAAAGAVQLTTAALVEALVGGNTATYTGTGKKYIPSGTAVGRTIAERNASTGFGPLAAGDDEIFLTAFDIDDAAHIADVELVRHKTVVKENFLPGFTALAGAVQTLIRGAYHCIRGVN